MAPTLFGRSMVALECAAMVAFVAATVVIVPDQIRAANHHGAAAWMVLVAIPLAHVAADLFTGFMHFFADNFGSERTPFLGPAFIRRFREHHCDQKAICKLSFRELNGGLVLVASPIFVPVALWLDASSSVLAMALGLFAWTFVVFGTTTNQVHRWAHDDDPPKFVRWLALRRLILSAEHHETHHRAPHDTHFCITHGWLNPVLDRLGVWHLAANALAALSIPQFELSVMGRMRRRPTPRATTTSHPVDVAAVPVGKP
jgi:hypothetical protein